MYSTDYLWAWLPIGYLITVAIELPVLLGGLSYRHSISLRFLAGFWLTACTYPIVILVMAPLLEPQYGRFIYMLIAETFAPAAECALFYFAFLARVPRPENETATHARWQTSQDFAAIILANLLSFGPFEIARQMGWIDW